MDRISIVVNRYDPNNSLRIEDLKSIVNHDKVYKIANDFQRKVALQIWVFRYVKHQQIQKLPMILKNLPDI